MKRREFLKIKTAAGILTLITPVGLLHSRRSNPIYSLEQSFNQPPESARPFTWWHWINGNVTMDGITRDLEAMAQVGIGGFQAFSVNSGIPTGPADYLSPLWIELMKHAAVEAERLGLEFDVHNCMGWSSSGGSWITPELSMQQVVWSEAFAEGGKAIKIQLKQPFSRLEYYRDSFVLAFPSVQKGPEQQQVKQVSLNRDPIDVEQITGFDLSSGINAVGKSPSSPSFLLFEYEQPVEVRSIAVNSADIPDANINGAMGSEDAMVLEISDDDREYKIIAKLSQMGRNVDIPSIARFPVEKAKYFRLQIPGPRKIANVRLSAGDSINDWPFKANYPHIGKYNPEIELDNTSLNEGFSSGAIHPDQVIDISEFMNEGGELNWNAPAGEWTIIRFGHTTTGVTNHPAEDKGLGLECDKYSREAFEFHFNYLLEHLMPALSTLTENGKLGMLIDSYEVNLQNWTKLMPEEFQNRRGYSLIKYLPVLTGRVVGNVNTTERFLWDFRRTCADLMAENYQDYFVELCKKHQIISYTEPYNRSPFEQMQAGAKVDINMGEFWIRTSHFCHSLKMASSIQNMHGRQVVGAESFTGRPYYSRWQEYPFAMKSQGDFMFTRGLNRFIFHRYAHQPHPTAKPGMTMGPWGFHFDRTNTWFFQGRKWLEYVSRCQYLLQQGVFVGDVMCYTGMDAPGEDISMGAQIPDLPPGYDFQFANSEILLQRIRIENGRIVLPDGLSFRLMVLPTKTHMTTVEIRKLRDLVRQGMILVGPKPDSSPSLSDSLNSTLELKQTADELWGGDNTPSAPRKVGKGSVFSGISIKQVLDQLQIKPDFDFTSASGDAPINYIHRRIDNVHVYFVANRRRWAENIVCSFRISGLQPEFWDADTGEITPAPLYKDSNGTTKLPLQLDPGGSVFIVFRAPISQKNLLSITREEKTILNTDDFKVNHFDFNNRITNTFTVSLWVKPETEDLIPKNLGPAPENSRALASFAVDAPPGKLLFGEGHTAFCLLVARNGVVVFEKSHKIPSAVLIAPLPVSGWTHFAVVYQEGMPKLYVNGKFIKEGKKSGLVVHPAVGLSYHNERLYYYDGDMSIPQVFDAVLSEKQITGLFANDVPETGYRNIAGFTASKKTAVLIWENGNYKLSHSSGEIFNLIITSIETPKELTGEWLVTFPPGLGAPENIVLPRLSSLHTRQENGVKYFSGTATYHKNFVVEASLLADGKRVFLDLGRVAVIAEVVVNSVKAEIVWKPPYQLDITDAIKIGSNELQIKVTNLWPNRLIGDEQFPAENEYQVYRVTGAAILELPDWYKQGKPKPAGGRITFTTWQHFEKDAPLLESGLIGPVLLRTAVVRSIF